jgi:hypothetical protein
MNQEDYNSNHYAHYTRKWPQFIGGVIKYHTVTVTSNPENEVFEFLTGT